MKTPIRFTALALSMLLASGVVGAADLKVGVTMSAFDDTFLTYLREDMDKQAKSYPKVMACNCNSKMPAPMWSSN